MQLQVLGDGSFGTFLKSFLAEAFDVLPTVERDPAFNNKESCPIVLAVPLSALKEVAEHYKHRRIINVCSVQEPSNNILWEIGATFVSVHFLFGARTPPEFRNAIFTKEPPFSDDLFSTGLGHICKTISYMSAEAHDRLMANTHLKAIKLARSLKGTLGDYPDHLVPHSFRLLKRLVDTLNDTPQGTVETIFANEY